MIYKVLKLFLMVLLLVSYCEGSDNYYVADEGDIWVYNVSTKTTAQGKTKNNSFNMTY